MFERFQDRRPLSRSTAPFCATTAIYGRAAGSEREGFRARLPAGVRGGGVHVEPFGNAAVYDSTHAVEAPVLVVRAMEPPPDRNAMDFRSSPTWPGLARHFRHGSEVYHADRTHFLPMEDPALVAGYILADD